MLSRSFFAPIKHTFTKGVLSGIVFGTIVVKEMQVIVIYITPAPCSLAAQNKCFKLTGHSRMK